jgi:hypothetical protein
MGELDTVESAMRDLAEGGAAGADRRQRAEELLLDGLRALCTNDEQRKAVERLIILYRQVTGGLPPRDDLVPGAKTEPLPLDSGPE